MTYPAANVYGDRTQAEREARSTRMRTIMAAPEAYGQENVAFALAIRGDSPAGRAIALLAERPALHGIEAIFAWVDAIPARPSLEIVR